MKSLHCISVLACVLEKWKFLQIIKKSKMQSANLWAPLVTNLSWTTRNRDPTQYRVQHRNQDRSNPVPSHTNPKPKFVCSKNSFCWYYYYGIVLNKCFPYRLYIVSYTVALSHFSDQTHSDAVYSWNVECIISHQKSHYHPNHNHQPSWKLQNNVWPQANPCSAPHFRPLPTTILHFPNHRFLSPLRFG